MIIARLTTVAALGIAFVALAAARAVAQDGGPAVGDMAPDFALPGATQAGLNPKPIHLSDFRGQTVVLAFFPKARTKG